ncbi:hypothetical protein [Paenibacillus sp. FSL H8-0034]
MQIVLKRTEKLKISTSVLLFAHAASLSEKLSSIDYMEAPIK